MTPINSINPATGETLRTFDPHSRPEIDTALEQSSRSFAEWRRVGFEARARLMHKAARGLREGKSHLAEIITSEMGKTIVEAEAEVE